MNDDNQFVNDSLNGITLLKSESVQLEKTMLSIIKKILIIDVSFN